MPTPTYDLIATTTLAASSSEVVFSSLPQTYRDLVLVSACKNTATSEDYGILRFNSDSGTNYSRVQAITSGNSTAGAAVSSEAGFYAWNIPISTTSGQIIFQIMDYSATDKHKTLLSRFGSASANVGVIMSAGRWASSSAITAITLTPSASQFASGSTFALYGIAS